jgi:hypothetical protein
LATGRAAACVHAVRSVRDDDGAHAAAATLNDKHAAAMVDDLICPSITN